MNSRNSAATVAETGPLDWGAACGGEALLPSPSFSLAYG
jgi:hypothetical protein